MGDDSKHDHQGPFVPRTRAAFRLVIRTIVLFVVVFVMLLVATIGVMLEHHGRPRRFAGSVYG